MVRASVRSNGAAHPAARGWMGLFAGLVLLAGCAVSPHRPPHVAAPNAAAGPEAGVESDSEPEASTDSRPATVAATSAGAELTLAAQAVGGVPPRDPVLASWAGREIRASEAGLWFFKTHREKAIAALQKLIGTEIVDAEARSLGLVWPAEDIERARAAILADVQESAAVQYGIGTPPERWVALRFGERLEAHLERRLEDERQKWLFSRVIRFQAMQSERVELAVIVVKDARHAEEVSQKLAQGADFATLARQASVHESAKDGGKLTPLPRESFHPRVAEVAFALPEGSVSGVLEIDDGAGHRQWEILRVLRRVPRRQASYAEVREEIERDLIERPVDRLEWSAWMLGLERRYNARIALDL